jgi:subtilisin
MGKPRPPAWSDCFVTGALEPFSPVLPSEGVTREWAWGGSTGKGVRVAVIDSGIDAEHPALRGPVNGYVSITEKEGKFIYDTSPHQDSYGHGTACGGIIRCIAPECELYSIKVLGSSLAGRGKIFAAGLQWAIENDMHVCNLSLGTTKKDFFGLLHELADRAYFRRMVLVAAANNLPVPLFPAMYASVISVASHNIQDVDYFYYNPHPPVEFGAWGIDVRVAWLEKKWITSTGNSFATPHITGHVACILSKHPTMTPFQVKSILCELANNVT